MLFWIIVNVIHETTALRPEIDKNEYDVEYSPPYTFLFIFGGVACGTISKILLRKSRLPFVYSIGPLAIGMLCGVLAIYVKEADFHFRMTELKPYELSAGFFPILVFNIAFCTEVHTFVRSQLQVIIISVPVFVLTACIIGVIMGEILDSSWPLKYKILLGALCTPIYAVAMDSLLKVESFQSKRSQVLLQGESMLGITTVIMMIVPMFHFSHFTEWLITMVRYFFVSTIVGLLLGFIGRLMMRNISEFQMVLGMTLIMPFLGYLSSHLTDSYGSLSVLILGAMMADERTSMTREMDQYIVKFWECLNHIARTLILLLVGIVFARDVVRDIELKDYALILVTYFVSILARFLSFLLFSPILSRVSYGMTFPQMLVLVCGGLKGSVNLICAMYIYHGLPPLGDVTRTILMHVVGMVIINFFVNPLVLPILIRIAGSADSSLSKEINMNNCIKHIQVVRERTIATLKMDRFLADANWPMVQSATTLKHPYQIKTDSHSNEDDFLMGYRLGYCSDCKKEVLNEPTRKELKEMQREARLRVLKAKKISYCRQFENGMLSLAGMRLLIRAVEIAMDSPQAVIELEGLYQMFRKKGWAYYLHRYAMSALYHKSQIYPPRKYWRRFCYNIVMHKIFPLFMFAVILLSFVPIVLTMVYRPGLHSSFHMTLLAVNTGFYSIFLAEFLLKILGYSRIYICKHGFRTYFKSGWNIFDFIILIIHTCDIMSKYILLAYFRESDHQLIYTVMRLLRVLRFLKLLSIWESFAPKVLKFLDSHIDRNIAFAYEIGKAYVKVEQEVMEMLPYMIEEASINDEMRIKMEDDRLKVTKCLAVVHKERPWIAITVKTTQAMTTVLNHMGDSIDEVKVSGWADEAEHAKLKNSLNPCYKHVRSIKCIQRSSPRVLFKEIGWLEGDMKITDYLYDNVVTKKYNPGDYICKKGEICDGIYVLISGVLSIKYVPHAECLTQMDLYGTLPIVDFASNHRFDNTVEDYIIAGNTFGELCTLTNRCYNSSILADTNSQVFVLNCDFVKTAMLLSPDRVNGLECRIWKSISIKLAISVLMEVPAYQGVSRDKIRLSLERSFMPNLSMYKSLTVNDMMKDIILIDGIVIDGGTRDVYVAPKYIPRNVGKLLLPGHKQFNIVAKTNSRLLIIPIKYVEQYEVMEEANEAAELMSLNSNASQCLQHTVQSKRPSIYKKKARLLATLGKDGQPTLSILRNSRTSSGDNRSRSTFRSSELDPGSIRIYSPSFDDLESGRKNLEDDGDKPEFSRQNK